MTAQFIAQYDGSSRAQFVAQYASTATTLGRTDDFDSAIGTVGTITNPTSLTPSVQIVPFNSSEITGWLTVYVRVYGLNSKTPTFTLDFTDWRESYGLPSSTGWVMMWRYRDDSDPGTINPRDWTPFDNQSGDPTITFSNNAAFSQDEIEIAVKPRWRYVDTQRAFAYAALSSYASQLGSANSSHVFNTVTLTSGADNSATPTTLNQYGILLDNTASQPAGGDDKLNVIILLSQHSSEDQGNYYGWRLIEQYLDGVGATYDWFRQHCRLYIYDVNPAGRYYGAERWTQEQASDEDPNRSWDDSTSEQVNAVKTAISTDVSRTDVLLDFHGSWRLGNQRTEHYGLFTNNSPNTTFETRFEANSAYNLNDLGSISTESAEHYAYNTLSAQLALTVEFGMNGEDSPTDMWADADVIMLDYIEALKAMVDNSELTLTAASPTTITVNSAALAAGNVGFFADAEREVTASGSLAAQAAALAGEVQREITASASLVSQSSTAFGTSDPITNVVSAPLSAQDSQVSGTASRVITASGALLSAASDTSSTTDVNQNLTSSGAMVARHGRIGAMVGINGEFPVGGSFPSMEISTSKQR